MGKILKADAALGEARVRIDLALDQSELWLTYSVRYASAALAFWASDGSSPSFDAFLPDPSTSQADFLNLFNDAGDMKWNDANVTGIADGAADVWHLIEHHFTNGGLVEVYVDGVLSINTTDLSGVDAHYVDIGLKDATADAASVAYFDDVKIGTTRGGSELFTDDFEDGTLDAWTTISGDVSVIDDPFAAPVFTFPGVFDVAFTDPTLEAFPTWTAL